MSHSTVGLNYSISTKAAWIFLNLSRYFYNFLHMIASLYPLVFLFYTDTIHIDLTIHNSDFVIISSQYAISLSHLLVWTLHEAFNPIPLFSISFKFKISGNLSKRQFLSISPINIDPFVE
jgi:hypothetical protein